MEIRVFAPRRDAPQGPRLRGGLSRTRGGALAAVARPLAGKAKTIDGRNPHDARNYAPVSTVEGLYELMTARARARARGASGTNATVA